MLHEIVINRIILSQTFQNIQSQFFLCHPGFHFTHAQKIKACIQKLDCNLHVVIVHGHRGTLNRKVFSQIVASDPGIPDDLIQCPVLIYPRPIRKPDNGLAHIQLSVCFKEILIADICKNIFYIFSQLHAEGIRVLVGFLIDPADPSSVASV